MHKQIEKKGGLLYICYIILIEHKFVNMFYLQEGEEFRVEEPWAEGRVQVRVVELSGYGTKKSTQLHDRTNKKHNRCESEFKQRPKLFVLVLYHLASQQEKAVPKGVLGKAAALEGRREEQSTARWVVHIEGKEWLKTFKRGGSTVGSP